ncbi:hypothetical protein V9T40_011313 [Parthenolecanium corni]|uniref:Uncharacterized protein n=1 Tax=Parthenolecanium corni TaxID=536013 RepID=A0AAN9XYB2_9HEMI
MHEISFANSFPTTWRFSVGAAQGPHQRAEQVRPRLRLQARRKPGFHVDLISIFERWCACVTYSSLADHAHNNIMTISYVYDDTKYPLPILARTVDQVTNAEDVNSSHVLWLSKEQRVINPRSVDRRGSSENATGQENAKQLDLVEFVCVGFEAKCRSFDFSGPTKPNVGFSTETQLYIEESWQASSTAFGASNKGGGLVVVVWAASRVTIQPQCTIKFTTPNTVVQCFETRGDGTRETKTSSGVNTNPFALTSCEGTKGAERPTSARELQPLGRPSTAPLTSPSRQASIQIAAPSTREKGAKAHKKPKRRRDTPPSSRFARLPLRRDNVAASPRSGNVGDVSLGQTRDSFRARRRESWPPPPPSCFAVAAVVDDDDTSGEGSSQEEREASPRKTLNILTTTAAAAAPDDGTING